MKDFFRGTVTQKDWIFVGAILGITVLVGVAFYFLGHTKQKAKIDTKTEELRIASIELQTARKRNDNFKTLQDEAKNMQQLVERFNDRLPSDNEFASMIGQFEKQAKEIGLDGVGLNPMTKIIQANKETIPYKVKAEGNFHEIVSFINRLERNQRYLKISDIDIGEENAMGISSASFTMSTFRFTGQIEVTQ